VKQASSFSEEKEAKRLFRLVRVPADPARVPAGKSFLVLFFKKEHSFFPS
jgi:hypothetical protein